MKFFALLFAICFIAANVYAATNTIGGGMQIRHYYNTNYDGNKDDKEKQSEWRTYAAFNVNSVINDKLSGKIGLRLHGDKEKWALANGPDYATVAHADSSLDVFEAYLNYKPLNGLTVKLGRQAWAFGNKRLIGNVTTSAVLYSQNGLLVNYTMPELFSASLLYSVLGTEEISGTIDAEKKQIPADKFYGLWLKTMVVPFVQDINAMYLVDFDGVGGASTATDKTEDTLTTMGIYAAGNAPAGPVTLNYSLEYYMNGGKDKTQASEVKYSGSLMAANLKATLVDLFGLNFGGEYLVISGNKGDDSAKQKAYIPIHPGAPLWFDGGYTFLHRYSYSPARQAAVAKAPGANLMRFFVGASPLKNFSTTFEYDMLAANVKEAMDNTNPQFGQQGTATTCTGSGTKAGIWNAMQVRFAYTGIENLALSFAVGQEKMNKDNFANAKDSNLRTAFKAAYSF